jgi:hypothetical protein
MNEGQRDYCSYQAGRMVTSGAFFSLNSSELKLISTAQFTWNSKYDIELAVRNGTSQINRNWNQLIYKADNERLAGGTR